MSRRVTVKASCQCTPSGFHEVDVAHPPQDRVRPQPRGGPMLKTRLIHPGILEALGEAGHGAQVLIADGNYPLRTRSNDAAHRVYLNLAPGLVSVTDVLRALIDAIPIEAAHVMAPEDGKDPAIFAEFRKLVA